MTGDSNGGFSLISKSASRSSSRRARRASIWLAAIDDAPLNSEINLAAATFNGVAVVTRRPKSTRIKRIGTATQVVTNATKGAETPYPSQPPPPRISVAPSEGIGE